MHYLSLIDRCLTAELESELRYFFRRLHQLKQRLNSEAASLRLNRIQRSRCKENILNLENAEREFCALSYREDIRHLYRKLHRYVKLDQERPLDLFGEETINRSSIFVAL